MDAPAQPCACPDNKARGARRAVVKAGLLLAPMTVVGEPLEAASGGLAGRQEDGAEREAAKRLGRDVAADAGAVLPVLDVDGGP